MSVVLDNFIDRLTSNYSKNLDSNVGKLLKIAAHHIQGNEDLLNTIGNWRDIDQATGSTLDKIGGNVQQNRGQAPDEVYRVLIKSKIKRNLSDGSINTLIDFMSFILQVDKKEISIRELWASDRPATLHIDAPAHAVSNTGLTYSQFGQLTNLVVAAGVKAEVLFEGTFAFGSTEGELAATAGFADDLQTTGGQLGYIYDPAVEQELPI